MFDFFWSATTHLRYIYARPEKFQVFPHSLRLVFTVENSQLGEHSHVSSLESQSGFQKIDEFFEVTAILIIIDQVLQLVGVHDYVQTAHLGQSEFTAVHAGETNFLPSASRISFARAVHGALKFFQVYQRYSETREIRHVVVKQLRGVVHLVVETSVADLQQRRKNSVAAETLSSLAISRDFVVRVVYLLYVGVIRTGYELLEIREPVGSRVRVYQFALDEGFARLFASHLQIANQIFPMRGTVRGFHHVHVRRRIVRFDEAVNRLLNQTLLQLSPS